jgi:hypothetical protein
MSRKEGEKIKDAIEKPDSLIPFSPPFEFPATFA